MVMFKIIFEFYYFISRFKFKDYFLKRAYIRCINIIIPTLLRLRLIKPKLHRKTKRAGEEDLIVSLTTYPARISKVWLVLESILSQTIQPDRIILWLYDGEFPRGVHQPELVDLINRGLEIQFCSTDLRPHNKYYHTLLNYPKAHIITLDDDMIYPPRLIERLLHYKFVHPGSIICSFSMTITLKNGVILPYVQWSNVQKNTDSKNSNLTMGYGGALYPSGSLSPEVLNSENIRSIALAADDLWLKVMSAKVGTKVVCIAGNFASGHIPIYYKNDRPLMKENMAGGNNDRVLAELIKVYNIDVKTLQD
jgi:hypothetical protein